MYGIELSGIRTSNKSTEQLKQRAIGLESTIKELDAIIEGKTKEINNQVMTGKTDGNFDSLRKELKETYNKRLQAVDELLRLIEQLSGKRIVCRGAP
jgi:predicted  nucleic acid-binding Zn-ribbon protein